MALSIYEPPTLEIALTLGLGLTVLSPYYRGFVRGLDLRGDERVLDYGSGSGILSRHIAARLTPRGGRLDCVDVSHGWQKVIRRTLRRYGSVAYHLGRLTQLSLPENSCDVVVVHFVLHEVDRTERPAVLKALAQVLHPAGRIVLREPQGKGLTADELQTLAAQAGLQVERLDTRTIPIGAIYDASLISQKPL